MIPSKLNDTAVRRKPGENMTHLVFPDTFSLSHVSRSASVILATVTKLGASRWGPSLPWILRCARSSLWRSGTCLSPSSAGPLSRARTIQVTLDFTSSVWPWFLSIWSRPPRYWKNQVPGRGADKQNVKHGNSEAEDRMEWWKHLSLSQKYGINCSLDYFCLCYPFDTGKRQSFSTRWQTLV